MPRSMRKKTVTANKEPNGLQPLSRRQIAAGANRAKRRGITAAGREKLRQAALTNRPWEHSTGPQSVTGKARSALNGALWQKGRYSIRQIRTLVADDDGLAHSMVELRRLLSTTQ